MLAAAYFNSQNTKNALTNINRLIGNCTTAEATIYNQSTANQHQAKLNEPGLAAFEMRANGVLTSIVR